MRRRLSLVVPAFALGVLLAAGACKRSDPKGAAPSASVPARIPSALPIPPEVISRVVNPKREQAYAGPTATLRGTVRAKGDPAPEQPEVLAKIPSDCANAREMYAKLFREGEGRTLGDVLVTVTGYEGYVPSKRDVLSVEGRGCAWSARTFAVTFGERIDIVAKDRRAYVPDLMGANMPAQIVVTPGGAPSPLYAQRPGRYVLVDSMRIFATAEILVLKYSTFDVTDLDGKYEIAGIPVGKAKLGVILPATGATIERSIELEAGKTLDLDLELPFDAKAWAAKATAPSGPAPSAAPQ